MTAAKRPRTKRKASRVGRRAGQAAQRRARVRAERPKQKPKRTPKPRSRARRVAKTAAKRGAAPRRTRPAATAARPAGAGVRRAAARARRRAPKPAPPPAFPQATGAPAKQQLLFRMVKARASVLAAIQGLSAAEAERPLDAGQWSTRETILHLVVRDRIRLRDLESALRGVRPAWLGMDRASQARANAEDLAPLARLTWEEAVRLLHTTRQELMEAVESVAEEPEEVWGEAHPFGGMLHRLPPHDLHHAEIIKRRRVAPPNP